MLSIETDSLNSVWLTLLRELYERPEHQPEPRGLKTNEITGVTLRINDMRNNILYHPVRNLNYKFQVAEWLWIAFGRDDVATLTRYNSQMARFSDDGLTLAGAYGPRLKDQWQYVVDSIARDYYSRQAVATIWTPNPTCSRDVPCTVSFQFLARHGKLNLIATMRSSDVWLGLPYDVGTFALLANGLAGVLGLELGYLQMQLGSSHLYETDFNKAKAVMDGKITYEGIRSPRLPSLPCDELQDVLVNPKSYDTSFNFPYPWSMYADVLSADSWEKARQILAGVND